MPNPENLKNFPKGKSGNPKGRPKGALGAKKILKRFLSIEMETENPLTGATEKLSIAERMHMAQIAKAINQSDTAAYKAVLDRLEAAKEAHQEKEVRKIIVRTQEQDFQTRIVFDSPLLVPDE